VKHVAGQLVRVGEVSFTPGNIPGAAKRQEKGSARCTADLNLRKIAGRNPVLEALKAGTGIREVRVFSGRWKGSLRQVVELARSKGITIRTVEQDELDKLATGVHQGVVALADPYAYADLSDVLAGCRHDRTAALVVLDHIQDPHNLGSIIRTAEATGVVAVIIPEKRAAAVSDTVARTSAGAVEHLPVCQVKNLARLMETLKGEGFWIAGADAAGDAVFNQDVFNRRVALVVGSEGKGLRPVMRKHCDFMVSLPMYGKINSLNASVAAGILMYEIRRQQMLC